MCEKEKKNQGRGRAQRLVLPVLWLAPELSPQQAPPLRHAGGVSCLCRCSAERGGENRNEKRDCAKQPPPLREMGLSLTSKARNCIAGASEATQLWRKGKTRNTGRHMKNSTEREGGLLFCSQGLM